MSPDIHCCCLFSLIYKIFIRYLYDGFFPPSSDFSSVINIALISIPLFLFPGFTEEFAWRGFLQEKLQAKNHAVLSSIIVGCVWASWHGMDYLMGNWAAIPSIMGMFLFYTITLSIIIGWFYNRSGGNVLIAMIGHFGANATNFFMPLWKDYDSDLPVYIFLISLGIISILITFLGNNNQQAPIVDSGKVDPFHSLKTKDPQFTNWRPSSKPEK